MQTWHRGLNPEVYPVADEENQIESTRLLSRLLLPASYHLVRIRAQCACTLVGFWCGTRSLWGIMKARSVTAEVLCSTMKKYPTCHYYVGLGKSHRFSGRRFQHWANGRRKKSKHAAKQREGTLPPKHSGLTVRLGLITQYQSRDQRLTT